MNKWKLYQTDKHRKDATSTEMSTFTLILWLLFSESNYIVNINKMKDA